MHATDAGMTKHRNDWGKGWPCFVYDWNYHEGL